MTAPIKLGQTVNSSASALHAAAIQALQAGHGTEGYAAIMQALALTPNDAALLNDAAAIAQAVGDRDAARSFLLRAVAAAPCTSAYVVNLGVLHRQTGAFPAALACMDTARTLEPRSPEVAYQRALTLARSGDDAAALAGFQHCLALRPDWFEAEVGLATALQAQDRLAEAIGLYRRVIRRNPDRAAAHNNLGRTLLNVPDPEAALACFDRALALAPHTGEIGYNRALTLLGLGRYAEGWRAHAARWTLVQPPSPRRHFDGAVPRWDGTKLAGRRLLLHAEQGLGDTIQFIRFAGLARQRGLTTQGSVVFEAPIPLLRLLGCLSGAGGIDRIVAQGDALPPVDVQLPLLDLPRVLDIGVSDLSPMTPYLHADVAQPLLGNRLRVGVVWAGNPLHSNDRRRSMPAQHLRSLVQGVQAEFISLQTGPAARQLDQSGLPNVISVSPIPADFRDTAERLASLNLVVSVDTSTAHLAAAMGIATWLLVPFVPDWRWGYSGGTTPWYPTMRLFRQPRPGDWSAVCADVRNELKAMTGRALAQPR